MLSTTYNNGHIKRDALFETFQPKKRNAQNFNAFKNPCYFYFNKGQYKNLSLIKIVSSTKSQCHKNNLTMDNSYHISFVKKHFIV